MASKSSLDLEGALVDRAIENVMTLPQEVQEAVTLQRLQNSEITRCEQYLNSMLVGVLAQKLMGTRVKIGCVSMVWRLDSPTLLHKIEEKWKWNICSGCLNHFVQYVFQCLLRWFERNRTIELSDYRAVGLEIGSLKIRGFFFDQNHEKTTRI